MGSKRIVITNPRFGRSEHEANVFVPDPVGNESSSSHSLRVKRFLDQTYGINGWRDIEHTSAFIAAERGLLSAALHRSQITKQASPPVDRMARYRPRRK